eukprot:s1011_g25.t1
MGIINSSRSIHLNDMGSGKAWHPFWHLSLVALTDLHCQAACAIAPAFQSLRQPGAPEQILQSRWFCKEPERFSVRITALLLKTLQCGRRAHLWLLIASRPVQMDQPAASTRKPPTKATKAQTEADVDPGEIEVVEASLRDYFLNDYKGGGAFEHEAYEHDADEWCWIHKRSGIKVWQDALDLTQSGRTGEVECLFHYTNPKGFRNITAPSKKAVEVFASLVTEGPDANAWWGQGKFSVYSVRSAPDEWPDMATLIDNNYRNMHARDVKSKGREAADEETVPFLDPVMQEYASRVAYCIPILANSAMTYDVLIQQTPEMQKEAGSICLLCPEGPRLRCRANATAKRLGPEHGKALQALSRLAWVLEERGAFAEAEPLRRGDLEATERLRGPEHRRTLIAVNNLARVLKHLGRPSEAEPLYRRALAGCEAQHGADHQHTLSSMNNLAVLLDQQGKLDEAEELHRRALGGRAAQLGAHHPDTLQSISSLALVVKKQSRYREAEELHRRALAGREAQLGAHHPDTLQSISNLALVVKKQSRYAEAEGLLRRALKGGESQLGPQHPTTLIYANNLANLLERHERNEAEELYRRVLTGREDQLGSTHPDTLVSVYNLAALLEAKGSFAEAGQLYLRELHGLEELHGPEHEKTQASRRNWEQFQRRRPPAE